MCRRAVTITAAAAILAAGWLVSGRAEAGASASAPSKFAKATETAAVSQAGTGRHVRHQTFGITEYSSSSATHHSPNR